MNNIPVLRVFDAQGKGIEIPAIKGEKGDLTSTVLLSAVIRTIIPFAIPMAFRSPSDILRRLYRIHSR